MLLAFFCTLFASLGAEEVCDAAGACREEESLLQTLSKGEAKTEAPPRDSLASTFCPEFFQAEDVQYASMGVRQAEEIVLKYCLEMGIALEECEEGAGAVFRHEGEDVQDLTADLCTDLVALSARATEMKPEFPAALLARQTGSGRGDDSGMDAAMAQGKSPPTPSPPPPAPTRRRLCMQYRTSNEGRGNINPSECRRRGGCSQALADEYKRGDSNINACIISSDRNQQRFDASR